MTDVGKLRFTYTGGNDRAVPEDKARLFALSRAVRDLSSQVAGNATAFASYLYACHEFAKRGVGYSADEAGAQAVGVQTDFLVTARELVHTLDKAASLLRTLGLTAKTVEDAVNEMNASPARR